MRLLKDWKDDENLAPEYVSIIIVSGIIIGEFFVYIFIFMKNQISEVNIKNNNFNKERNH